ncbi:MAG: hypothetical protein HLUCCX21_07145 [Porphyrobacter sp. HL-46]|nr:MAG: hypothetical protein HLUCCX21_07145 [Porphyrobacter sp. HL-46]
MSLVMSALCAVIAFATTYATMWLLNGNPQPLQVSFVTLVIVFSVNLGVRFSKKLDS